MSTTYWKVFRLLEWREESRLTRTLLTVSGMGRARVILQSDFPYNISARCINKEWFSLSMSEVWDIFCEELNRTTKEHGWVVHSFVLMGNHFHLIVSTPYVNISLCMHQFMTRTSRRLTAAGNRINETYAGRHYKCILQHNNFYLNAYKYNYRNPVTAGLCDSVEDYPFSTLYGLVYPEHRRIKLALDSTFQLDSQGTLIWLNEKPDDKKIEAVRYGFKRQYFKSKKDSQRRVIMSENDIL